MGSSDTSVGGFAGLMGRTSLCLGFWLVKGQEPKKRATTCAMRGYGVSCWVSTADGDRRDRVRPGAGRRRGGGGPGAARSVVSGRCGRCGARAPFYDRGEGRRRWRGLDWGTVPVVLEADAPRVNCLTHGPTVIAVPWARHHAGHTYAFDDTVAWLAVACSKTAVCQLMRIAWRTVGAIVARVWANVEATGPVCRGAAYRHRRDLLQAHHNDITVVVDHDSGRLIWAARPRQPHLEPVLRRAGTGAVRPDHPRLRRCGRLDRRRGDPALPGRDPLRRSLPRGQLGHQGPR